MLAMNEDWIYNRTLEIHVIFAIKPWLLPWSEGSKMHWDLLTVLVQVNLGDSIKIMLSSET